MKKMKKRLVATVAATLALSVMLTGCGNSNGEQPASGEAINKEEFKAGFVYLGAANDAGYTQAHDEGRRAVEEKLGIETMFVEKVPDGPEAEKAIMDMIDQGANIIFDSSFGHMDYMLKVAEQNPDVKFMHCTGYKTSDNMSNYFGRMYQARYLTGMVAGMQTEKNHIGYVASMPIPEVIRGINAFTLGVQEVNPDAVVEVVWTNTWYDPSKEKEAAKALIEKGVDVLAQHQDTNATQLAAEEAGIQSIGYHKDMSNVAPNAFLTAPVWNWENFYIEQVEAAMNGTWEPQAHWKSMADGVVDLAPFGPKVKEETKAKVEAAKEEIINAESETIFVGPLKDQDGNIKVEDGVVLTDEELLSMNWFVEGVVGEIQ